MIKEVLDVMKELAVRNNDGCYCEMGLLVKSLTDHVHGGWRNRRGGNP